MKARPLFLLRASKGQTLIEFVLLLPLVLLLLFIIFDFGRAIYYRSLLSNAAREGARYGAVAPGDTAGILAAAKLHVYGIDPANLTILSLDTGTTTNTIRVTVSYNYVPATPIIARFLPLGFLALSSQAEMRIER